MTRFRSTLAAVIILASLTALARPAAAIEYPWCAQYSGEDGGGRNCGFSTLAQCMATVSGIGGDCEHNLFYEAPAKRPAKPVHKRRHHDD